MECVTDRHKERGLAKSHRTTDGYVDHVLVWSSELDAITGLTEQERNIFSPTQLTIKSVGSSCLNNRVHNTSNRVPVLGAEASGLCLNFFRGKGARHRGRNGRSNIAKTTGELIGDRKTINHHLRLV